MIEEEEAENANPLKSLVHSAAKKTRFLFNQEEIVQFFVETVSSLKDKQLSADRKPERADVSRYEGKRVQDTLHSLVFWWKNHFSTKKRAL